MGISSEEEAGNINYVGWQVQEDFSGVINLKQ